MTSSEANKIRVRNSFENKAATEKANSTIFQFVRRVAEFQSGRITAAEFLTLVKEIQ